jgi:hypothetical protein
VSLEARPDGRWDLARWGSCGDGSVVLAEGERLLTGTALREEAVALAAGLEAPVAVAVLGEAPARAVAALLAGAPGLVPLQLAPQPDPRAVMPRALFAAGAACGLLVRPAPQGAWRVEPAGACGPVPSAAERVARAVAGDLRTAEDLADALALRVVDTDGPPDRGPDWSLQDGDGFVLTSLHMALQLGDEGAVERLERERRSRAGPALTLALTGWALQFVGGVQMLVGFDTAHSAGDYTERTDGLQLGWTGVVMTGAGALVASAAPLLRHGAAERRRRPDRFYSREEAEARVAAYDRELARALGVDEPQDEPGGEP